MSQTVRNAQDPSYVCRQDANLGALTAGSGGQTVSKFIAFAALQLFGLTSYQVTLGTSTYTQSGTATASGQQLSVIVVQNTSSTTTVALATTTYGPFLSGGQGTAAQVGGMNQYALNTTPGTGGFGGVPVSQGARIYVVSGTDATAVSEVTIDYQVSQGAGLTQ